MENEDILTPVDNPDPQSTEIEAAGVEKDASATNEEEPTQDNAPDSEGEERVDYAALAREDLLALKKEFPSLADMSSLSELENPARYGALRELGLTAREAYLATTTPKAQIPHTYDNRSHLRSSVPRTHGASGEQMSANEMRAARALFSDLSDSEIVKLYKKVHA